MTMRTLTPTRFRSESYNPFRNRTDFEAGKVQELDGAGIWYHDTGGPGEVVVLLGGFTAGHFVFDFVREHMEDHRLITWEPRGLGPSFRPDDEKPHYSVDLWADDLRLLLSGIGVEKAHLWADGFGGFIALRFAAEHPEMVHSVITSTEVSATLQDRSKNWNIYSAIVNNLGTTGRGARLLAKWMDFETLPWFVSWESQNITDVLHLETVRATVGYGLLDADVRQDLNRIKAPTLLLLGDESPQAAMRQTGVHELHIGVENLEIEVIEGAHPSYGVVTHPLEFAQAARDFFRKHMEIV